MNARITLVLAIAFQGFALIGMYVNAAIPLWTGQEIRVATIPVDPRSLFRGNYAQLRYAFDVIRSAELDSDEVLRNGEVVYVLLEKQADGTYAFSGASLARPDGAVALRGRVTDHFIDENEEAFYGIHYGIDAFFAPKERALALEQELRDGGIAVLMVAADGRARIKDILGQ